MASMAHSTHTLKAGAFTDLLAQLRKAGWRIDPPQHLDPAARRIDEETAATMVCGCCGRQGLEYVPLHKGQRYRALAACPRCDWAEEM